MKPVPATESVMGPEVAEHRIAASEQLAQAKLHHEEIGVVSEILGLVYDAAADERLWAPFVHRFTEVMNGKMPALFFQELEGSFFSRTSIHVAPRQEPLGAKEIGLMRILMPHLQRALQLRRRLGTLESERDTRTQVLDRIPFGVVLVGAEGQVVVMNRVAKSILDLNDGLSLAKGRLMAASGSDARKLKHLVRRAARTGVAHGIEMAAAMPISRPSMRRPLGVLVVPLRTKDEHLLPNGPCAAVFLSDAEAQVDSPTGFWQRTYGLTPSEAAFCALFVQGKSVREIAQELRITVATARVYLKRVLAKTDTHRQAALMRLLLTCLPAVLLDR